MKAMAIVRECSYESIEEQRLQIAAYAEFEGINVTHVYHLVEDNYKAVYEELPKLDAVIVTNISRISKELKALDEFNKILKMNSVKLISMFS
jgi:hypothetical protein